MMIDYESFDAVKNALEAVQGNEKDERQAARECLLFVTKANGQWEDGVWRDFNGRPRYTFDRTTPIINMIVGEMEQNEFGAIVEALNDDADEKQAELIDGILRGIQNQSDASFLYKRVAKKLTTAGFDCLRIHHDYLDEDSFDQSLFIKYIPNSIDRVWFDPNSEEQDRSDADYCFVLQALTPEAYKQQFPKGDSSSVGESRDYDSYTNGKRELIIVGEFLYKKYTDKALALMANGKVVEADGEEYRQLIAQGVMEKRRRSRKVPVVHTRFFGGSGWLSKPKETAFRMLPVVPFYHGFEIVEDKIVWRRIVEKMMDAQRVYNYAKSRQIEEGALAPRKKFMMTREQAKGHENQLKRMNTSPDPVQFYNHIDGQTPPYETGGAQVNPSLALIAQDAGQDLEAIAGMYAASLAKNPGLQSGVAINTQIDQGNTGNTGFFVDLAKGITYLCRVLVDTLPRVVDTQREMKAVYADGTGEMVTVNETVYDQTKGGMVTVNDLSKGRYSVTCSMGPMFRSRAEKTQAAIIEYAKVDPSILQIGGDILANTIDAPGMDDLSARIRAQLLASGAIPPEQMTEEEKAKLMQEQMMAMQQGQQQDPLQALAQGQLQIEAFKQEREAIKDAAEIQYKQAQSRKLNAEAEAQELENDVKEAKVAGMVSGEIPLESK